MATRPHPSLQKTLRSRRRFFVTVAWALVAASRGLAAQGAPAVAAPLLDEAEVIRLARMRAPAAQLAVATEGVAEARTRTAALLPNPALSWARETVQTGPEGGQGSQDILTVALPVELARPWATRALVASESAWVRAEAALARTAGVVDALLAFYDVVLAERRVELLSQALANLEEAARVLATREEAGSASGYESTRLTIARELSRSDLAEASGGLTAARIRLGGLLEVAPEAMRVTHELTLLSAEAEAVLLGGPGPPRESLRQARESAHLADEASVRARWAWFPVLELGGGVKRSDNFGEDSGYGYVVGLSLALPLFDHGQAERQQADAQRALAQARSMALTRSLDAEAQQALATFRTAQAELSRFEAKTLAELDALLAAAQAGYREGERTVVELLDAQRAQTEVAERRLSLLGTAKRAEVRLRGAAGDLP